MSYFRVIPPKKEWIWAVPNNILQPLPLVDYLGHGRGEKKNKTRQSMFVKHVPPLWAYFKEAT